MAEKLSQKQIDEFLSISSEEKNEEKEKTQVFGGKVFSATPKGSLRFKYEYHSPVIEKENIIYNPSEEINKQEEENPFEYTPTSKVIARSVENYNKYKNKKILKPII